MPSVHPLPLPAPRVEPPRSIRLAGVLVGDDPTLARPAAGDADLLDEALTTAWFNQYQLGVLVALLGSVRPGEEVVADVVARAARHRIGSDAAVGAAASLLGCVRTDDAEAVADCFGRASAAFTEDELRAGAAALTAALTGAVADALALAPADVHHEMIDAVFACGDDSMPRPADAAASGDAERLERLRLARRNHPSNPRRHEHRPGGLTVS